MSSQFLAENALILGDRNGKVTLVDPRCPDKLLSVAEPRRNVASSVVDLLRVSDEEVIAHCMNGVNLLYDVRMRGRCKVRYEVMEGAGGENGRLSGNRKHRGVVRHNDCVLSPVTDSSNGTGLGVWKETGAWVGLARLDYSRVGEGVGISNVLDGKIVVRCGDDVWKVDFI